MEPLTTKEFIDIASKCFTLNHRSCAVCEHLPMDKVCEVTLDILFDRRSFADMQRYYTQFATQLTTEGKVLGEHRFRHHRDKCSKDKSVFSEVDLRKLGILQDEAEMLQRLYAMKNDDVVNPTAVKEEIRRQRIHNLYKFEMERREHEDNVIFLEQSILPKTLEGTFQLKSGSVEPLNLLRAQEKSIILSLTKQIDVMQSDIEKNAAASERASKSNTTVIQVMNTSLADMKTKFEAMLDDVKSSLDTLLPNQSEIVMQVMRVLVNHMNQGVVPVLEKTKEVLQIEAK